MRRNVEQRIVRKNMAARSTTPSKRRLRHRAALSQRMRGVEKSECTEFAPPEDWYEPAAESSTDYAIVLQSPGHGFRHVLTPEEIRSRLALLPAEALKPLDLIQLSRMTRKKLSFPCYGMQWGQTLYLYPIEESLIEYYSRPPCPAQMNEARMYGGKWVQKGSEWKLVWSEAAIKDFYLNNILIHELGHLLDNRNTSYTDRERYAEWFAIEHGFKQSKSRFANSRPARKRIRRRHHTG